MLHRARRHGRPVRVDENIREARCVPGPPRSRARAVLIPCSHTVTLAASGLFLVFGVVYLYEALLSIDPETTDFHPDP